MSIPIAPIITVLVVILLSMLVTRIATIALTLTGMSEQAARFQARSALTGAGFTTAESEAIVSHPVRRRVVGTLMLFGSAGIVTVLASVMLTFAGSASRDGNTTLTLVVVVAGAVALLLIMKVRAVDRAVSRLIRLLLRRFTDLDVRDYAALLDVQGGYSVSELRVDEPDWIAHHSLEELRLNDEGVIVLGVQRLDGTYVGVPDRTTRIRPGDVLIIYGHRDRIVELDVRESGEVGENDHRRAVLERTAERDAELGEGTSQDPDPGDGASRDRYRSTSG